MSIHHGYLFIFFTTFLFHSITSNITHTHRYVINRDGAEARFILDDDTDNVRGLYKSNKNHGVGYTIGVYRDNVNLYVEHESPIVRSIPSNYTFYFYNDNNKFYIRNNMCNFLCVDVCGMAFMSPVRYKHYCKFYINSTRTGNVAIFLVNKNGKRRNLKFDAIQNILKIDKTTTDSEEYPFVLKNGPIHHQNECRPIARTVQQILNVNTEECNPLKKNKNKNFSGVGRGGVEVSIKRDDHQYYGMRLIKINDDDNDDDNNIQFLQRNHLFVKHNIIPGVYVLQNAITCEFVCQNSECGVYMSNVNNGQCKVHLMTNRDNSFYVRLHNSNNYNLIYNTTTNMLLFAENDIKSRVKLIPIHKNKDTHRYVCNNLEMMNNRDDDDVGHSTNDCKRFNSNTANVVSLSLFYLFVVLVCLKQVTIKTT
ncbi:fgf-2 [Psilogramma increta granulovirus]|uniref:Fgf-2 n=1 Tax=Psilogramma increta granulovirus TaxID=2953508 RepID=A0A977XU89_9BBAC|nr:fgf-2 [Psilogramma increta granulovirus]